MMSDKLDKRFRPVITEAGIAEAVQRYKTLPSTEVQVELDRLGIDAQPTIDAVKAIVASVTPRVASRRTLHKTPRVVRPAAARVFAGTRRRSIEARVQEVPHETAPWRGFFCREAEILSYNTSAATVVHEAFEHLGAVAGDLRIHCAADLDAVWPSAECIVEAGIEVAAHPTMWRPFTKRLAEIHEQSGTASRCMLVHVLHQLFALGPATAEIATASALEFLRTFSSPDARMLLIRLVQRHTPLRDAVRADLGLVDSKTREKVARIDGAKHEILENFPELRVRRAEGGFFVMQPVAMLIDLLAADVLSSFLAMYALGEAYLCAATLIAQDPKPRQKEQHAVFSEYILQQLRSVQGSLFLTVGSLEPVRDRYPRFAATMMASLIERLAPDARAALFVSIVEGYERSFRGVRQAEVPRFELEGSPRFEAGAQHGLDVFGSRVCDSPIAEELRPHMKWANERLGRWSVRRVS
jgi:hypothetical protein